MSYKYIGKSDYLLSGNLKKAFAEKSFSNCTFRFSANILLSLPLYQLQLNNAYKNSAEF